MEQVLLEIARGLRDIESLDDLLPRVLASATEIFGADRALFAICDSQGNVRRAVRHNMHVGEDGRLPISDGLIQQVLNEHRTVFVQDTAKSHDYNAHDSVKIHNIRFMLGVPVMSPSHIMGVLYVDSTHGQYMERNQDPYVDKQRLLEGLAGVVSLVLRHLQALEEQQYRERFTAAVFHNVRSKLHVIGTNADEVARCLPPDALDIVESLKGTVEALSALSTSVLELHKLEEMRSSPVVWLDPVIELRQRARSFDRLARSVTGRSVVVEVSNAPMILTDAARFGMVVDELVLNAIKYSAGRQPVTVNVLAAETPPASSEDFPMHRIPQLRAKPGAEAIRLKVTNANRNGRIPREKLERMFDRFRREDDDWRFQSSGLGLSVVRELVASLAGAIHVESDFEVTSFVVDLPVRVEPIDD